MSLPDRPSPLIDPAAQPRSFAQRLQLLVILLIVPVAAVTLPALLVTGIFGQRPKPKKPVVHATPTPKPTAHATPAPAPDTSGLTAALNHSAESLLPVPAPLSADTVRLSVRADHVAARAEKVANQAKLLGGAAVEGVAAAGEKHLFVDVPAGCADAFRQAVTKNEAPVAPTVVRAPNAARDQLEVVIRPAADDE